MLTVHRSYEKFPDDSCTFPIMHLICLQKVCISIVFNFSWDGCKYPGEKENKGYVKFWGANQVHYGS